MSLSSSMDNVIDNLKTKGGLTYSDVYNRLMELGLDKTIKEDKAYYMSSGPLRGEPSDKTTCSYCRKHYPSSKYTVHTWNICRRLKADQYKKEEGKGKGSGKEGRTEEKARVVIDEDSDSVVSALRFTKTHLWAYDTAASSQMTANPDIFMIIEPASGRVCLADDGLISYTGRGTIMLRATLPNGKFNSLL